MSATPITPDSDDATSAAADQPTAVPSTAAATGHPDPITGEPGAHPVGVGVGALSAGAAGAAIGSIGGPIGVLIGAAIGAVAGGLAGKEVASTSDAPVIADTGTTGMAGGPPSTLPADTPIPIAMGSVPGEGFRAAAGSGFADDLSLTSTGISSLPVAPPVAMEDDALPMTSSSAAMGLQAPPMPENTPLMGSSMPANGEEAVRVAAYYHFLDRLRAGRHGNAMGDWLEAEREMMLN